MHIRSNSFEHRQRLPRTDAPVPAAGMGVQ